MRKFRLGIIGRCLALQPYMALSDIYHKKLKEMLEEQRDLCLNVSLASDAEKPPRERLQDLLKKKPIDGVLFHAYKMRFKQGLIVKHVNAFKQVRYGINPLLLPQKRDPQPAQIHPLMSDWIKLRRKRRVFDPHDLCLKKKKEPWVKRVLNQGKTEINCCLGELFKISQRKIQRDLHDVSLLIDLCNELSLPLFVLGAIPLAEDFTHPSLLEYEEALYAPLLKEGHIPSYFMRTLYDSSGEKLYKNDGAHLNAKGHAFLAQELFPRIDAWLSLRDSL